MTSLEAPLQGKVITLARRAFNGDRDEGVRLIQFLGGSIGKPGKGSLLIRNASARPPRLWRRYPQGWTEATQFLFWMREQAEVLGGMPNDYKPDPRPRTTRRVKITSRKGARMKSTTPFELMF